MELSEQSIHDVIHPTAAFSKLDFQEPQTQTTDVDKPWDESWLNPKNRIDSLDPPRQPLWRIDGCTAFGSQFYAVPLFLKPLVPMRLDVFIPEPASLPPGLREVLDIDATFHTRDGPRIAHLGITRHILRLLQYWISTLENPQGIYSNVPFGSRIAFNNLPVRLDQIKISIAPTYDLERQMLTPSALQSLWSPEVQLPEAVDIRELTYIGQVHDSVCTVSYQDEEWIFKALTSYTKFLYHELGQLLSLPPHPNIVDRPAHLITKRCSFGGKNAVVGFTLKLHKHGSVRDLIPVLQLYDKVSLVDETRWAQQLASALLHMRKTPGFFYPDLRLDNIVLSESMDAIMVDFEQRGVWCEFAAPEVNAIEYIRLLAIDVEIPLEAKNKYKALLCQMLPDWEAMCEGEEYKKPLRGYNVPWACLTSLEQEACEVYMLGRVLWCIFEGKSAPQRAAVWLSYQWEPQIEFPGYSKTPQPMRHLIDRCTRGRQPGLSRLIVREKNQLVLRELENTGRSTAFKVQQTASEWWSEEIKWAERWLKHRLEGMARGCWKENYYERPRMAEVLASITEFRRELGFEHQTHFTGIF